MSRYSHILLLVLVAGVLGDPQSEFDKLIEELNNGNGSDVSNVIKEVNKNSTDEQYDIDKDKTIPVSNLKRAIANLYSKQGKYRGSQNNGLFDLQEEIDLKINDNRLTNNAIFRWTVTARQRLNFIVQNQEKLLNLERIKDFTADVLSSGNTKVDKAVSEHNLLVQSLTELQSKSREIKTKLQEELVAAILEFEEYERNRTEFNADLKTRREENKRKLAECKENNIKAQDYSIHRRMRPQFVSCADLERESTILTRTLERPSKEDKKVATNKTYKDLLQALEILIVGENAYVAAITKEISVINDLKAKTIDASEKSADIKTFVMSLEQLAADLDKYIQEHITGSSSAPTDDE